MKSDISWVRRGQRLIRMVSELHRLGYQHLRIMPYEYPLAWRLVIAPRSAFSVHNGAHLIGEGTDWPYYSSSQEDQFFDWGDTAGDDARTLANKFIERFPRVCEQARGRDWAYAGWLSELIGTLETGGRMPILTAEWLTTQPYSLTFLPIHDYAGDRDDPSFEFPLPPPGDVDNDRSEHSGETESPWATMFATAAQPNYLGSPEVVQSIVGELFATCVNVYRGNVQFEVLGPACENIALIVSDDAAGYTRMPGWHTEAALGKTLITYLELRAVPEIEDSGLAGMTFHGMAAVTSKVAELLTAFNEDGPAEWERDALPQLNELHSFVTAVLMGTNTVYYPDRLLSSFAWQPARHSESDQTSEG